MGDGPNPVLLVVTITVMVLVAFLCGGIAMHEMMK